MSNMPNNGKTYTEVVLEFTRLLAASDHRQTVHNGEVMTKLARGDEKFIAIYDKMDGEGGMNERIKDNSGDIETNSKNITKVRNLNLTITTGFSALAAWLGWGN